MNPHENFTSKIFVINFTEILVKINFTEISVISTEINNLAHKSSKNQHVPLIMCCVNSNDKIIDFLYTKIMKIDEK